MSFIRRFARDREQRSKEVGGPVSELDKRMTWETLGLETQGGRGNAPSRLWSNKDRRSDCKGEARRGEKEGKKERDGERERRRDRLYAPFYFTGPVFV